MWEQVHALVVLIIFTNTLSFTESTLNDDPHWVKYNPTDGPLPADAIVGGYGGYQNETLYIARAPHVGSLTPGKYVPSTHKAIISWGWLSHVKTEFEILCGRNYKWVPTTTDNIPEGAVFGGYIQNSYEPLYVGRVHYSGQILPGKVAVSHGVLYFGYEDREIDVKNFEILVKTTVSSSDDNPHWVKYNSARNTLPADAIVGGYEDETLYIARAPYVGSLTPGKYVPSMHRAIISWGWLSHVKTEFEILCGRNYKWVPTTTDNIPEGAVVGGYIQNSYEPLYVGRVHYKGQVTIPGKVAVSHKVMYFAYGDKEVDVKYFEILVKTSKPAPREYPHWVKYNPVDGPLPADAIVGGYGGNLNETLYIARAPHVGSLTPGKYVPSMHKAIISWGWWSHVKTEYEILVGHNYKWVPTTVHHIPDGAVVGGYIQDSYEPLFVGRVHYLGQILPGKVAVSHGVLYFGYEDREIDVVNFEILVFDDNVEVSEKPKIIGEYNVTATSGQTVKIECQVTEGVPKPLITWQFRAKSQSRFVSFPGSDSTLNISNVDATNAGTYKCVATNDVGDDEHDTELFVQKSTNSDANAHWVQFNPATDELPADAIVGGYQNETLYIARAPHKGSLTPGMYVPSTHKAYVTWSSDAHPKTVFEILCGRNYKWVPTTTDYIPDGAVVGGYIENSYETEYIGRTNYSGYVIPGKVAVSHGVLYFAYEGRTTSVRNFEILVVVKKKSPRITGKASVTVVKGKSVNIECEVILVEGIPKPTISWEFKFLSSSRFTSIPGSDNVLRLSNVNATDAGTYKCVATNDVGQDQHITELIVSDSIVNPHWISFNPEIDELPADAIVGGYQNETLYIARAPHEGSLTPGMYVPSTHKAYVTWSSDAHPKTVFEILCGRNYKWVPTTTDSIPEGAVLGGYIENSNETEYVGRTNYLGYVIPGKVAVSHKVLYFAYEDRTMRARNFEILVNTMDPILDREPHWVKYNDDTNMLPDFAIPGGHDLEPLFIARAPHEGSLTPGKFRPSVHQTIISWGGVSHIKENYEILCGVDYEWIPTTTDNIPNGSVIGGYIENTHEPLFVGRSNYLGEIIPGKVAKSHGVMYLAFGNREIKVKHFEILTSKSKKSPVITGSARRMAVTGESVDIECKVLEGTPKPTISWQFKAKNDSSFKSVPGSNNVLRLTNVNTTDAGTYMCVATNDVGHDEHLTELMVPKGVIDPYWFSFDPNFDALPNAALVGGYENETLYIALAEHEESINPGTYVPSEHKAYITWEHESYSKNHFQILCGDNYIWVPTNTSYIPDKAFRGGYIAHTYEPLYVCKANNSGHVVPGKVAVSQGACYIAYGGKTVPVTNFEILVVPEKSGARITGKERETVVEGQSINIECRVTEGIPEPTMSWEFKAKSGLKFVPIPGSDNVLHISRADATDAGTYKCTASNDSGYSMHRTELIVQTILDEYGIIHEEEPFRDVPISVPFSLELKCGTGDPSESIRWFNNGVSTEIKGRSYVLEILDKSFEGHNYTCLVSGDNGTNIHTFVLTAPASQLQFSLQQRDPILLDLTGREGYELNCDVEAKATPNISWTFNGKLIDNQNSSRLTFVGNWGTYTCKVSTVDGTIQRSFDVTLSKCIFPREPKYVKTTPLILSTTVMSDYTTDYIKLEPGQTLKLSCPDSGNETNHFQKFPLRHEITAHCVKGDEFIVKDKSYKLSDLECTQEVQAAVVKKHQKCWTNNNNSELLGVGYGFSETYEVCFDTANNIPLYIPGKISKSNRGGDVTYKWRKYRAVNTHGDTYTCDNMTSTCCYSKAQLVNARDVSAGPPQRTTFIDPLNAVMLWHPCDLPQSPWEVMESSVRMLTALKDEFKIWSGTYMSQNLNGTIIPRYLWKAVEKTIALIYINGPSPSTEDILCTNICGTSPPWPSEYKKHIYCCDLEDFLVRFGLQATNVGEPLPGGMFHSARLLF